MRVVLAVLGLLVSPLITVAAAQAVQPPLFNLSGTWELTEYGARINSKPAIVEITHTGNTVAGVFVRGSECFNGVARSDAFLAELKTLIPGLPPSAPMSGPAMWVCSNDPALVKKCGGAIQAIYKVKITEATAALDFIQGSRVTQGVNGCNLDSSEDGTADFSLRRLTPCELEQRTVTDREDELRELVKSILGMRTIFKVGFDAAMRRYPDTYQETPTDNLAIPVRVVEGEWDRDIGVMQSFFEDYLPDAIGSNAWKIARDLAAGIGLQAENPLLAVREMLNQMYVLEGTVPEGLRVAAALRQARAALEKCQQAQR
jgi:hypothetical protein